MIDILEEEAWKMSTLDKPELLDPIITRPSKTNEQNGTADAFVTSSHFVLH
jgi:hypothetical protein